MKKLSRVMLGFGVLVIFSACQPSKMYIIAASDQYHSVSELKPTESFLLSAPLVTNSARLIDFSYRETEDKIRITSYIHSVDNQNHQQYGEAYRHNETSGMMKGKAISIAAWDLPAGKHTLVIDTDAVHESTVFGSYYEFTFDFKANRQYKLWNSAKLLADSTFTTHAVIVPIFYMIDLETKNKVLLQTRKVERETIVKFI